MAYDTDNPPAMISSRIGSYGAIWAYRSDDAITTVTDDDYFTNGLQLGMTPGDAVLVYTEPTASMALTSVTELVGNAATVETFFASSTGSSASDELPLLTGASNATTNASLIQTAIDGLDAGTNVLFQVGQHGFVGAGGTIRLPAGAYYVALDEIDISRAGVLIRGASNYGTALYVTGSGKLFQSSYRNTGNYANNGIGFRDFLVVGDGTANQYGMYLDTVAHWLAQNVTFYNMGGVCIKGLAAQWGQLENVWGWGNNDWVIDLTENRDGGPSNNCRIYGGGACSGAKGVQIAGHKMLYDGGTVQFNSTSGLVVAQGGSAPTVGVTLKALHLETSATGGGYDAYYDIDIQAGVIGTVIDECSFFANTTKVATRWVRNKGFSTLINWPSFVNANSCNKGSNTAPFEQHSTASGNLMVIGGRVGNGMVVNTWVADEADSSTSNTIRDTVMIMGERSARMEFSTTISSIRGTTALDFYRGYVVGEAGSRVSVTALRYALGPGDDTFDTIFGRNSSTGDLLITGSNPAFSSDHLTLNGASGTPLYLDANNAWAMRNGTTAQTLSIYNTRTDASNYERCLIGWSGNTMFITNQQAGTGTIRSLSIGSSGSSDLNMRTGATTRWKVEGTTGTGHLLPGADATYDVGNASLSLRPRDVVTTRDVTIGRRANYIGISTGLTAHAGGGQGSATLLSAGVNVAGTVAAAGDSFVLPAATASGAEYHLYNGTSTPCNLYPGSGDSIGSAGTNNPIAVAPGVGVRVIDTTVDLWVYSAEGAPASGKSIYSTIPINNWVQVAYGGLGAYTVPVAGTIYWADVYIDRTITLTGIAPLNAGVVGTNKYIVALYDSNGTKLANSTTSGTLTSGTFAFQPIAFTATCTVVGPARFWIAVQLDGTTDRFRTIAGNTFVDVLTTSATGSFGTLTALTVPTTFTANVGPIAYAY